jgi:predicted glycoside hydrolase/deacetylase ChbG (UPF0249 family)
MPSKRYLVVNADDFGQSPGINRGIRTAHEHGIVTSASLMVRWPAAAQAAIYSREHPALDLGLHLDLGEWCYGDGTWKPLYEVVPLDDAAAVRDEVGRQLDTFRRLMGKDPTHLDSHQHVHRREPVYSVVLALGRQLGVPVRHHTSLIRYCGDFYGQTADGSPLPEILSVEGFLRILRALPSGATELGCHPGEAHDLATMYREARAQEVATLCAHAVRAALVSLEIELCTFGQLSSGSRDPAILPTAAMPEEGQR